MGRYLDLENVMSVRFKVTDTSAAFRQLMNSQFKNVESATAEALSRTAYEIRDNVKTSMIKVFDRPTPYTLRGLYVVTAKPSRNPFAIVGVVDNPTRGTAHNRFINPSVDGGQRSMKGHEKFLGKYTGPSRQVPRDSYGNVPGSFYKRVLSQLKLGSDPTQFATTSRRSKAKANKERFFIVNNVLLSAKGDEAPKPMLFLLSKSPSYRKRLPFYQIADDTFNAEFSKRFFSALQAQP